LDGSTRPSNCIAAHALLTESPRVAAYITRLTIFLPSKDTIPEEVEEVESLVQILSRLANVRRCILEGDIEIDWQDLAPSLSSVIPDFLARQPLHELHVLDIKMMPLPVFSRLLRAAPMIFLLWVSIAEGDDDDSAVSPGEPRSAHTLRRLGLKQGTKNLCEVLTRPQLASETAALRDLEIISDGMATVHSHSLIRSAANTLERIRFFWPGASLFA
jgi:hypothetical protein